jgi:hypothetical protein
MVKVERPKTLFGSKPYLTEQGYIRSVVDSVASGVTWLKPKVAPPVIGQYFVYFSPEKRKKMAKKHFSRAKSKLKALGL